MPLYQAASSPSESSHNRSQRSRRSAWHSTPAARSADYWAYGYKDLEVMAEGTMPEAQTVGRRIGAIDEAMRDAAAAARRRERAADAGLRPAAE